MVSFLARAALCIGAVAAVATGTGSTRLATALDRGGREVVDRAGRACLASGDCLGVGRAALSAATGADPSDALKAAGPGADGSAPRASLHPSDPKTRRRLAPTRG